MKRILLIGRFLVTVVLFVISVVGCYDDTDIRGRLNEHDTQLNDHEARIKELERICAQQNTNLSSLQTILEGIQNRDYVTNVSPVIEGAKVIGYTITFLKSGSVTIYNGKDAVAPHVPQIGVKLDTDGLYYWTLDNEWIIGEDGAKIPVTGADGKEGEAGPAGPTGEQGVTPQLKIDDGFWYVSYDNGKTWADEPLGIAVGETVGSVVKDVKYDDNYLYISLSDGFVISVPRSYMAQDGQSEGPVSIEVKEVSSSTALLEGKIDIDEADFPYSKITIFYSSADKEFNINTAESITLTDFDQTKSFSFFLSGLTYFTIYKYCIYVKVRSDEYYSDVRQFITNDESDESLAITFDEITQTTVTLKLRLNAIEKDNLLQVKVYFSKDAIFDINTARYISITDFDSDVFTCKLQGLIYDTEYHYCVYVKFASTEYYSDVWKFRTADVTGLGVVTGGFIQNIL